MSDAERDPEPVQAFCQELRHLTRRSSLKAAAVSRRLHISRSQYYAIINGEVRRPPDWAKVEVIVRMCGESDEGVAGWRRRHGQMVADDDLLRTQRRTAVPETPSETQTQTETETETATDDGEPADDKSEQEPPAAELPAGGRRRRLLAVCAVALLAVVALVCAVRVYGGGGPGGSARSAGNTATIGATATGLPSLTSDGTLGAPLPGVNPEPGNPEDPNERAACVSDAPPAGAELLTVRKQHRPGNNKMNNAWWGSNTAVSFNAANAAGFDANIAGGTQSVWDVLVLHSCVPLVAGRRYVLRYSAAANPAGPVTLRVQDSVDPEENASYTRVLDYEPAPKAETLEFTALHTSRSSELTFQVGGRDTTFRLQVTAISLAEKS